MEKRSVVVVDDQASVCTGIASNLKFDYTVYPFTSGSEALEFLSKNHADIVLLDYEMPNMTGYEVLLSIRTTQLTKELPVIFLTAHTNERMKQEMMGRGATDYLCKPVDPNELKACIKKYLP